MNFKPDVGCFQSLQRPRFCRAHAYPFGDGEGCHPVRLLTNRLFRSAAILAAARDKYSRSQFQCYYCRQRATARMAALRFWVSMRGLFWGTLAPNKRCASAANA